MTDREFEQCMSAMAAGDRDSLRHIYDAYLKLIYAVVYDTIGQREEAEDVTSEFFIKLYSIAGSYKPGNGHKKWLVTIARNMAVDRIRKIDREALVIGRKLIQPRAAGVGAVGRVVFDDRDVQQRGKLRVRARERDRDGAVVAVLDVLDGVQAAGIQIRRHGGLNGIGRVLRRERVAVVEGAAGRAGEGPGLPVVAAPLGEQAGLGLEGIGELRERLVHEAADGEVIGILRLVGVHAGGRAVVERELAVELDGGLRVLLADGVAGVVRGLLAAGRAAEQQHKCEREREHAGQVQMFHGVPPWVTG